MSYRGEIQANTQITVKIGPFLDSTNGNTNETTLSIAQADIRLSKNGGNFIPVNHNQGGGNISHDELGYYDLTLDTTDSNTEGRLLIAVHESGALLVELSYNVLSQAAWASKYAAKDTGFMDINIHTVGRTDAQETEANNLESACANYSVTRGLTGTSLPAVVAEAAGGLYTRGSGAGQIKQDTNGQIDVDVQKWLGQGAAAVSVNGVPEVDLTHIGGQAISGNNASLKLKQLDIQNSAGSAFVAKSTGSNGHGMDVAGNGTGEGLLSTGGATGHGIHALGGATSGNGLTAEAATEGDGIYALAKGTDEHGIYAVGGDTTGSGIKAEAATSGDGILAAGATNGHGLNVDGAGSGEGISATGGATGEGIEAIGGATSGAGIRAVASNNNDAGMELVKHGTGIDLDSEISLTHIMDVILTEGGAGRLAAAFIKLFDVATPLLVADEVMRGTNGSNTTTPPTVTEIQAEMEENGASILDDISDLLPGSTIAAATDIPAMRGTDNVATAAKLLKYIQLLARSDAAIETDNATELTAINADGGTGGGNFSSQTDSEEAIRDRGDAAWPTATTVTTVTGNVNGSVGSVTGAVGSVAGNVDGSVASVGSGGITAASIATDAIDADALAADAVTEIQSGLATGTNVSSAHSTTDSLIDGIKVATDFMNQWINNRIAFTGTSMTLYADDGTTPLKTWTLSEGSLTPDGPYNRSAAS